MTRLLAAVLVVLALAATPAAAGCGGAAASARDFVGIWRESGQPGGRDMLVAAAGGRRFTVIYPRFYPSRGDFVFADGRLSYAPTSPDQTDVITYDARSDTITITSGSTGRSFTLSRATP